MRTCFSGDPILERVDNFFASRAPAKFHVEQIGGFVVGKDGCPRVSKLSVFTSLSIIEPSMAFLYIPPNSDLVIISCSHLVWTGLSCFLEIQAR